MKWGGDGQTGMGDQNRYVEDENGKKIRTGYIMWIVPLITRVKSTAGDDRDGLIVYRNSTPGGAGSLRAILKSTEKDKEDMIIRWTIQISEEIENI